MFLTLHIQKEDSYLYTARVFDGQVEVIEFQTSTLADAVRETADGGFGANAFHVWYGHVCIGTTSADVMRRDGETLAQRLVSMNAGF